MKILIFKMFFLLLIFINNFTYSAQAQSSVREWGKSFLKNGSRNFAVLDKIVIINGIGKDGVPLSSNINIKTFNKSGFMKAAIVENIKYSQKMNSYPGFEKKNNKKFNEAVFELLDLSKSDSLLILGSKNNKPWNLIHRKKNTVDLNLKAKGENQKSVKLIKKWLGEQLGYQGVVLATKGDLILVANLLDDFDGRPSTEAMSWWSGNPGICLLRVLAR